MDCTFSPCYRPPYCRLLFGNIWIAEKVLRGLAAMNSAHSSLTLDARQITIMDQMRILLIRMSVWRTDCVCVLLHNSRIQDFGALWQNATPRLQERPAHFSKKSHFLVYSQGTNKSSLVILFFIGDGGIDHLKDLIGISYYYVDLFLPSWFRRCNVRILVMFVILILYSVHPQASQDLVLIWWPGSRTNAKLWNW